MSKTTEDRSRWQPFVDDACAALSLDPAQVPIDEILNLTSVVAHEVARPMAPVAAFIVGLAAGRAGDAADVPALIATLLGAVRPETA